MHQFKRSERIGDLLREEIALIVMRKIKDPRLGFVTVTSVKVTDDLKFARVYVSVLNRENSEQSLKILNSAKGFIRTELSRTLKMKSIPQFDFLYDNSLEYGERIDDLLKKIREEK